MRTRVTALLLMLLAVVGPAAADGLQVPAYETVTLDNGMTLQLLRHATVPMVSFELWIGAGAVLDPAERSGLASLTAEALRKGAGGRSAEQFAEAVDFLGARFSTSVNRDRTRIGMNLLSKDFETGLALLSDAVLRPRFDASEIEKLAAQLSEGIIQAKDNPRNVLTDYHTAFLYGDHPYGNPVDGTEDGLAGITRDDVVAFHRDHYGADRAVLTVAGDIDPAAVRAAIERVFGSMPRAAKPAMQLSEPEAPAGTRVLLVNKNDTPQTWFEIGALGPVYGDPDHAATEVVRTIFGGRFTSWLNTKLRIETGLTYGAAYRVNRGRVAGSAYAFSFTATETTKEAMDLALAQFDRLHEEGIGEADLASAKAYLKGQTPYDYETASNLGGAITELAFYGLDRAELDDLFARIDAVTLEDCRRVTGKYFPRENLVITTVGVASEVKDILAAYGPVRVRENGDPGFR